MCKAIVKSVQAYFEKNIGSSANSNEGRMGKNLDHGVRYDPPISP